MKKNILSSILFLSVITTYYLLLATNVIAQEAIGLSVIPPRLEIKGKPGDVVTAPIKIRNESKVEKIINTTLRDFIVTDDKGTPVQIDNSDQTTNRWAASNWIQVSPVQVKIKPGETKSLMVSIIIPKDALSGGHYAMILHTPDNSVVINQTGTAIQTNVGTLVYITVPGDIKENAKVTDFTAPKFSEYGPINFSAIISNLSDVHITPAGSINVTNWFGGKTAQLALATTNIFPNTTREFQNTLERKWLFGRYAATLNAAYGTKGQLVTATIFFWVMPWRLMILVTIAIILTVVIVKLLKSRKTGGNQTAENQVVELEKELETLKKKYQDKK